MGLEYGRQLQLYCPSWKKLTDDSRRWKKNKILQGSLEGDITTDGDLMKFGVHWNLTVGGC
ncbi:hypothetical protein KY290_021598 [Solanum tuberosum]|uniref:Uncharacterized protein n=1 Tax=Solanum tuberosum TaxID=4113 RepID=A0ABQ7V202_SOLTU|nr:hypothetical protein KY284_020588 [Solanum tuberosum]KAH0683016.1 hypothetical protein KY289_020768 [Solanum tuberosum]KAH0758105.1 hypothetical protein KY290_021598 [Solanum tuberosum]